MELGKPFEALFDVHCHTDMADNVQLAGGEAQDGESVYPYRVSDYVRAHEQFTDRLIIGITEYDSRYPNQQYIDSMEDDGYTVTTDHGTHMLVEGADAEVVVLLGGQFGAKDDDGVRKDVLGLGTMQDIAVDRSSPRAVYESVAEQSKAICITHPNVMPTGVPEFLDPKPMRDEDIREVLDVAESYDMPAAIGRPTMYPFLLNWMSWDSTGYSTIRQRLRHDNTFSEVPRLNEIDVHRDQKIPTYSHIRSRPTPASNEIPADVFETFKEPEPNYDALFETASPTASPPFPIGLNFARYRLRLLKNKFL